MILPYGNRQNPSPMPLIACSSRVPLRGTAKRIQNSDTADSRFLKGGCVFYIDWYRSEYEDEEKS